MWSVENAMALEVIGLVANAVAAGLSHVIIAEVAGRLNANDAVAAEKLTAKNAVDPEIIIVQQGTDTTAAHVMERGNGSVVLAMGRENGIAKHVEVMVIFNVLYAKDEALVIVMFAMAMVNYNAMFAEVAGL